MPGRKLARTLYLNWFGPLNRAPLPVQTIVSLTSSRFESRSRLPAASSNFKCCSS